MRRRDAIKLVGLTAVSWPLAALAQQKDEIRRIGVIVNVAADDTEALASIAAFKESMQQLGWSEGRNLRVDFRGAAGDPERMQAFAKELVGLQPQLILTRSTPVTAAVLKHTRTIPIVFTVVSDPVGDHFVESLARPGGNVTGFTNVESSLTGKWLELLKEVAPHLARAAAIFNPETHSGQFWQSMESAAPSLAIKFTRAPAHDAAEIERAVAATAGESDGGLIVMPDSFTLTHRELIVARAAQHRLPSIYAFRVFPASGGLLSYGVDQVDIYRRAASYVDRILRGTNPAALPVEAPTKFELVINLKTANAIGLIVPAMLVARADEVIE